MLRESPPDGFVRSPCAGDASKVASPTFYLEMVAGWVVLLLPKVQIQPRWLGLGQGRARGRQGRWVLTVSGLRLPRCDLEQIQWA